MTLNDLVIRVKERTHRGNNLITSDDITAKIIRAVNDSRREVIRFVPKDWLRTQAPLVMTLGDPRLDLPADCQELVLVRYKYNNQSYIPSKIATEREFYHSVFTLPEQHGKPNYYFDSGVNSATACRQITFYPIPDFAYLTEVLYMRDPTKIDLAVSDLATEIPDIPGYLQDVLWKGAKYHFLECFDDPNRPAAKQEYRECLIALDIADEQNLDDSDRFRMDSGSNHFNADNGIRLK